MAQITNQMSTNLTLDIGSAQRSLKELTATVKDSTSEWKVQEAQLRAAGDAVGSSKAKYEGLQHTLDAQKSKVEQLKQAIENNNTTTKKGQDLQTYLTNELAKAERQMASYTGQIDKAKQAYQYQESGLAKLNQEVKHANDLTDARVQKLEAEGNKEEANKVKLSNLKNAQENYTKQLEIQKNELNKLAESGDKSSDSYKRQELRVEQMGAKLSRTKSEIRDFNHTDIKPETTGISKVKGQLESLNDKIKQTHSRFGSIFLGNLVANGVTNALGSIKEKLSETLQGAQEYNKEQQVMNATWTTLTDSASKGKEMVGSINQISTAFGQSNDVVNELSQQFYHVFNQKEPTEQLTKSMLTMADTLGMNSESVERLGLNFTHMMSSTKLQLGDFNMITDQLPMYGEKLLEYEQKVQNNSKLTMAELRNQMSAGKISAKDATEVMNELGDKYKTASENMMSTASGMERVINARGKALAGALIQPIMNAQNPIFGAVSKWVSDSKTEKEFDKVGKSISKAFGTITSAFSKEFKAKDFTNGADKFMNNLAKSIEKFGDYVAKHKDDIVDFFKMVKSLGASGFSTLGLTLKIALPLLEDLGKFAAKHPTTFKVLAGSIVALNLALKGTLATMNGFSKIKGLFIKPHVDGGPAKRELTILGKAVKGSAKGISNSVKFTAGLVTKGFNKALTGMVRGAKTAGKGIKAAFNFAKANPLLLIVTAVVAVGAALYELYKHNKKFRTFVNGLIKGVQNFFKGVSKWMGKVWSSIKGVVNKVTKIFKKDWKELLLLIINPFAGAFALVYKHNKKFRNAINGLVKSVKNFFTNMWKSVKSIFNHLVKDLNHSLNWFKKVWRDSLNFISDFISDIWNGIKKNVTNTAKRLWNNIVGSVNNFKNRFLKIWNDIKGFFRDTWNGIKGIGSRAINSLKDTLGGGLGKIGKAFGDTWDGVKKGFGKFWDGLKQMASDGLNAVISPINSGINGINSLIHDFGGPKSAIGNIPKVKFANGTGAIDRLTHAVLNDGNDSPETGNKETLIHPNGKMEVVQGRNTQRLLLPGTEVLNASETKMLMAMQGIRHFADGTGFFGKLWKGIKSAGSTVANVAGDVWDGTKSVASSAWDGIKDATKKFTAMFKFITNAVAHPIKTLEGVFNPKNGSLTGAIGDITGGFIKKSKDQAKDWWSELWSMAKDSGEGGSGGSSSELLNRAIKYGTGKPYVWGAEGPDSFDCSGLVMYTLKQMGKSFPHYSGSQYSASTPVSKPSVGDLVFFGSGGSEHVGIYSGGGKMFSAQSPDSHPNIGYAKISNWNHGLASSPYRRVPGLSSNDDSKKEDKGGSSLQKLIKSQVGGMFKWIGKNIAPLNDDEGDSGSSPMPNGSHENWLKQAGAKGDFSKWNYIINHESGWNPKAKNPGSDAYGIGQALPPSKMAKFGGDYMSNPITQLKWMKSYVNERYGGIDGAYDFWKAHHWYANGGLVTKHQIAEIGEGNKPEMIIPLDGLKSSRGYELLGKTMSVMAARDNLASQSTNADGLEKLESKFDSVIQLLGQLVTQGKTPGIAYVDANQASQEINKVNNNGSRLTRNAMG